ncbi:hypothetical protein FTV93_29460 (plasmid) [Escherichia coli]|uniref:Uncharacterized protein n=1 Tax=Escherichia coli TaxID=562 RepID=A0A5B9AST9_ECOLX|nr:hypothetical protein FTV93_29460 [Escherichia coli]
MNSYCLFPSLVVRHSRDNLHSLLALGGKMTVRYLNFQIQNITGGCYDWFVTLGKEVITGKLDEVKAKAMAYACKQARKKSAKA